MKPLRTLALLALTAATAFADSPAATPPVHAVVDLGHEFSFYGDGRFHRQYLANHKGVTSWGTLSKFDLSNANLLVLLDCNDKLRYEPEDLRAIRGFMDSGGGVLLLGQAGDNPQNQLARSLGVRFEGSAKKPLKAVKAPVSGAIEGGGTTLRFAQAADWEVLIADADDKPVLARRKQGRGTLLAGARGLAGSSPAAEDNINASWWTPLLEQTAAAKTVDPRKPFRGRGPAELDHTEQIGEITLRYSDYLKPYAKSMADIYQRSLPFIEKRMGVPLSDGMASEISLLATGGGGFSSGKLIGLAVFWGGFPDQEDSMIEFLTHESVHSWVLPFPEIWNEPIATYVGNLVMADMGHAEEGMRRIQQTIERATRVDPTMKRYDLDGISHSGEAKLEGGRANDHHWGKTYWIFEELRRENPDILASYFRAKRQLAKPGTVQRYDAHTTVAVLSTAMKRNLFPWFRDHGFDVSPEKSAIPLPAGL